MCLTESFNCFLRHRVHVGYWDQDLHIVVFGAKIIFLQLFILLHCLFFEIGKKSLGNLKLSQSKSRNSPPALPTVTKKFKPFPSLPVVTAQPVINVPRPKPTPAPRKKVMAALLQTASSSPLLLAEQGTSAGLFCISPKPTPTPRKKVIGAPLSHPPSSP